MKKISYNIIHENFKLNGLKLDKAELFLVAYSFIKEGENYEKEAGNFLLDWIDNNSFITVNTSGSTGKPKIIKLEKQAMVNSALATGSFFNLHPTNKILNCLSTKYIAGKMMFVRALVLGLEIDFVAPTSSPLHNCFKKYNFVAMVPLQVENSIENLHLIDKLIIGGARLNPKIAKEILKTTCNAFETYGMTETITHIAVKRLNEKYFTLLPNIMIKQDSRNCLVLTAPDLEVDNLVTNDVVNIVSENQFTWLGRFDNVINSGGVKLFPEQIEQKLASKIKTRFFVAGVPDQILGQKIVLFVEGKASNISESTFEDLDKYEIPKEIKIIPIFEETENGKIKRNAIVESLYKN